MFNSPVISVVKKEKSEWGKKREKKQLLPPLGGVSSVSTKEEETSCEVKWCVLCWASCVCCSESLLSASPMAQPLLHHACEGLLPDLPHLTRGIWRSRLVKVMTVNYNMHKEVDKGTRKFVFFNISKNKQKKPQVQIMMFRNGMPSPFLRFYLHSRQQVLMDVETSYNKEIMEHIQQILQKNKEILKKRNKRKSSFLTYPTGSQKYCLLNCICKVKGQVSCLGLVPLPKEMTGKYKYPLYQ